MEEDRRCLTLASTNGPICTSPKNPTSIIRPFEEKEKDAEEEEDSDEEDEFISMAEILYSASSYHAIARPVTIAMTLAALAATYINTEETLQSGAQELAMAYTVWKLDSNTSSASGGSFQNLVKSIGNTFVICLTIAAMTFVMVFLYKFRCMNILIGYMIFSSISLLGFLGGSMMEVAISIYRIPIDMYSFLLLVYNFAIVGILAIFYQQGIPTYITQAYLIATSVILAWNLSHFDDWTAWTLLVMLSLYDLCAVLSPCGPLKALVHLMQQKDSPEMPGLLYEAKLDRAIQRQRNVSTNPEASGHVPNQFKNANANANANANQNERRTHSDTQVRTTTSNHTNMIHSHGQEEEELEIPTLARSISTAPTTHPPLTQPLLNHQGPSVTLPLAIARLYKLPLSPVTYGGTNIWIHPDESFASTSLDPHIQNRNQSIDTTKLSTPTHTLNSQENTTEENQTIIPSFLDSNTMAKNHTHATMDLRTSSSSSSSSSLVDRLLPNNMNNIYPFSLPPSPNTFYKQKFTKEELTSDIDVLLPRLGGRIEKRTNSKNQPRYAVLSADGNLKRLLMVDRRGKVFEIPQMNDSDDDYDSDEEGEKYSSSIRLGLGDFIFYSVLVAKAAMYSFTTFAACILVILAGLGGTLVLLSVYHSALPALPISIFLGVFAYLFTRFFIEPWLQVIISEPFYV